MLFYIILTGLLLFMTVMPIYGLDFYSKINGHQDQFAAESPMGKLLLRREADRKLHITVIVIGVLATVLAAWRAFKSVQIFRKCQPTVVDETPE